MDDLVSIETDGRSGSNPTRQCHQETGRETGPCDIVDRHAPSRMGRTEQDRRSPEQDYRGESIVVVELSEWQSTVSIRKAQKAGLFLGVMLSLLLIPVGPWQWFPSQVAGVVLACLLWLLTLLLVSSVMASVLTILVLSLPSRPFRFLVRTYAKLHPTNDPDDRDRENDVDVKPTPDEVSGSSNGSSDLWDVVDRQPQHKTTMLPDFVYGGVNLVPPQ